MSTSCSISLFLSDNIKHDAATTTPHSKRSILLFEDKNVLTTSLGKFSENTNGCAKQYRCASEIYLMSVISQCYSIIIDWDLHAFGHGKEVVDGINDGDKCYIYYIRSTVELTISNRFDS